jgi:hypothetical protein
MVVWLGNFDAGAGLGFIRKVFPAFSTDPSRRGEIEQDLAAWSDHRHGPVPLGRAAVELHIGAGVGLAWRYSETGEFVDIDGISSGTARAVAQRRGLLSWRRGSRGLVVHRV